MIRELSREELRKIDALVAEHIMKEKDVQFHNGFADMQRKPKDKDLSFAYYPERVLLPFYTNDISHAWALAEEIHLFDDRYIIETEFGWGIYAVSPTHPMGSGGIEIVCDIDTAPLAICLAALSLFDVDIDRMLSRHLTLNAGDSAVCGCNQGIFDNINRCSNCGGEKPPSA